MPILEGNSKFDCRVLFLNEILYGRRGSSCETEPSWRHCLDRNPCGRPEFAADLTVKAPPAVSPVTAWGGLYFGASIGAVRDHPDPWLYQYDVVSLGSISLSSAHGQHLYDRPACRLGLE
jgi:hypothetical protein